MSRTTAEYGLPFAHDAYFGYYNMCAATQGNFEYPNNQRLLHEYHDAFMRVSKIITTADCRNSGLVCSETGSLRLAEGL